MLRRPHSISRLLRSIGSFALLISLAISSYPISLDSSFGEGGKFMTTFANTGNPSTVSDRVFVQPSGRIVVIGRHNQQGSDCHCGGIAIAGLTAGGTLDPEFGASGKTLIWDFNAFIFLNGVAMQPDGSFFVLYQFLQPQTIHQPRLIKYTPNGQVDGTFSADPRVVNSPAGTQAVQLTLGSNGKLYALVSFGSDHYLIRFNPNGSRDESFGPAGLRPIGLRRVPSSQRVIRGLHELPNGKMLITGQYQDSSFFTNGFAMRFNSDLNPDRSFGRQGFFSIALPNGGVGITRSIVLDDGRILLGGHFTFLGSYALLVRLTSRGKYDGTFGSAGVSMTAIDDLNSINGIALASDGRIFASGAFSEKIFQTVQQMFVARFSPHGVRESFATTGFIEGRNAGGADIALQPDGKMISAGFTQNPSGSSNQLAVARFIP